MNDSVRTLPGAKVVLLDIEGTVCPISFVKDVLFPYALSALPAILSSEWDSTPFTPYRDAFPPEHCSDPSALRSHYTELTSRDLKVPYLKSLQGYIWSRGYESGELRCTLFPDVRPALEKWHEAGVLIMIYSSGSVAAQKLLFQYTDEKPVGDLRQLISGWWDTINAGQKMEMGSYEVIVEKSAADVDKGKWLFLSDNVQEVEAAKGAGMQSLVVVRKGNKELTNEERESNVCVESFAEIDLGIK